MSDRPDDSAVQIRRYPNRRLYDRSRRQYVSLQDIEDHVLAGRTVEILDSRSGEDLTRQILTQILAERHPQKMELFPVAMLHSIIRSSGIAAELWRGYLRQSSAAIEAWQKAAVPFALPMEWMGPLLSAFTPAATGLDATHRRIEELADRVRQLEEGAGQSSPRPGGGDPLDTLEREVDRLEGREGGRKPVKTPKNGRS